MKIKLLACLLTIVSLNKLAYANEINISKAIATPAFHICDETMNLDSKAKKEVVLKNLNDELNFLNKLHDENVNLSKEDEDQILNYMNEIKQANITCSK